MTLDEGAGSQMRAGKELITEVFPLAEEDESE
jgi:hypothetical protein